MSYAALYRQWQTDPDAFWTEAAEDVHWVQDPERVLDDSNPPFYRWFPGGKVNGIVILKI